MTVDVVVRLRRLAGEATPGPWRSTTIGNASQWDAARRVAEAVLAVRAPDAPDTQFTDLSWVRTDGEDWLNVAAVGNGPTSPENARYIAAVSPDVLTALLDVVEAAHAVERQLLTQPYTEDVDREGLCAALDRLNTTEARDR